MLSRCLAGPPWPNGQGVGLLIRRLRVRVPQGVFDIHGSRHSNSLGRTSRPTHARTNGIAFFLKLRHARNNYNCVQTDGWSVTTFAMHTRLLLYNLTFIACLAFLYGLSPMHGLSKHA